MKSDMENRKWLDEYMSLKQVNENNPFTVPPGYFNELEQKITSTINLEKLKTGNGFTVPENYFNQLTSNIQSRINIEAYVNNDAHGHAVPADYFENMEQQISARIMVEEALNEQENFTVPDDYFDKLNKAILNKTVNQGIVKHKGVVRKMFASANFRYAAAACLALFISTGIFIKQYTTPVAQHQKVSLRQQLSAISTGDIQSYLQDDVDANETQHTIIDEDMPVNTTGLSNALQNDAATNN